MLDVVTILTKEIMWTTGSRGVGKLEGELMLFREGLECPAYGIYIYLSIKLHIERKCFLFSSNIITSLGKP